uniref:Kazal-like domain-containing protein n=1 Tax=Heterorhabditis bacteriophora TaxID=37862 RepID=A0A1I7X9U7_HETBA
MHQEKQARHIQMKYGEILFIINHDPMAQILLIATMAAVAFGQGPYFPNHWYGANQGNIRSGFVPDRGPTPVNSAGTLAPHVCGFNTFTRKCMDPENYCPGRCMNFRYTYNTLYDCRCLVIK